MQMKEIIYLDTQFLNSFLAQKNDGLPTLKSHERAEEIKDALESSDGHKSGSSIEAIFKTGDFEIPLVFKGPSGEIKGVWRPGTYSEEKAIASQTEAAKQIISTQMHDNALEEFIIYLNENTEDIYVTELTEDKNCIGKYVTKKSTFNIIDFDYLIKIMQADIIKMFMFDELDKKLDEINQQLKNTPKAQKNTKEYQQTNSFFKDRKVKIENTKKQTISELEKVEKMLKYLKEILPNSTFLIGDGIIAPLKEEFLREQGKELSFKYGNSSNLEITLLGKVTGKISSSELPQLNDIDIVLQLHQMIYFILESLKLTKKGDHIVSPVAIYFE